MNALTPDVANVSVAYEPISRITHPHFPPEIAKAVVAVSKQIGTLGKDGNNSFASYKYVSVDKFFDVVGRLMAKEGIFLLSQEVETKIERGEAVNPKNGEVKTKSWLSARYDLFLCHETGAMCGPVRRDIRLEATGPQTYGAAVAYVEKYFLRSLFKIPTGDKDVDGDEPEGLPAAVPPPPPPPPQKIAPDNTAWNNFKLALSAASRREEIGRRLSQFKAKYDLTEIEDMDADAMANEARGALEP